MRIKVQETNQPVFTCLKSTMKTPEKGARYVRSSQKVNQNDVNDVIIDVVHQFFACFNLLSIEFDSNCSSNDFFKSTRIDRYNL